MLLKNIGLTTGDIETMQAFFPKDYTIIFFGSRVNNTWQKYSDLDICLKSSAPTDMLVISLLREKFENSSLPFTVDIIDYQRCAPEFKEVIDKTGINFNLLLQ